MSDPAPPLLDPNEARLLGCLVEKEATTPEQYPLTENAALQAANQKTSREPVMALEAGEVARALRGLEAKGLARRVDGARALRFEHSAALALLVLRGPQTVAELQARSERLHRYADTDELAHALERLAARGYAVALPRAAGQREGRWAHLLCGPVDFSAMALDTHPSPPREAITPRDEALLARIEALEVRIAALEARGAAGEPEA